jgi:hypothetical protein
MQGNGTISDQNISKRIKDFLFKLYWEQVVLPINFTVFFIKFRIFKVHKRSNQSLIIPSSIRFDTKGEIERIEKGRDNMQEFLEIVPDECIIDLTNRWYCNAKK